MDHLDDKAFDAYAAPLMGEPVSRVWRGHGSALFLEFGRLIPNFRRDGTVSGETGRFTLMIQWSWRIEKGHSIVCGSWSDDAMWPEVFEELQAATVAGASLFGRLREIEVELSNGLHVVSFSTVEGGPQWTLFNRDQASWISVKAGALVIEHETGQSADILH
ncbi:MAG: hypothetical protein HY243_14895 [Proteobacteria bacterium]|nr:hypothetical protein [Pseudomonadota bacterium]